MSLVIMVLCLMIVQGRLDINKMSFSCISISYLSRAEPIEVDYDFLEEYKQKKKFVNILSKVNEKNERVLTYYGLMLAGAIARSAAATAVHPLNVIKTMLQCRNGRMPAYTWSVLSRGAGAQFLMSLPHGALSFAVTEVSAALCYCCKLLTLTISPTDDQEADIEHSSSSEGASGHS